MSWVYLNNIITDNAMKKYNLDSQSNIHIYITRPMKLALLDKNNGSNLIFNGAAITIDDAFKLSWINAPEWMSHGQVGKHLVFSNDNGLFLVIRNLFKSTNTMNSS